MKRRFWLLFLALGGLVIAVGGCDAPAMQAPGDSPLSDMEFVTKVSIEPTTPADAPWARFATRCLKTELEDAVFLKETSGDVMRTTQAQISGEIDVQVRTRREAEELRRGVTVILNVNAIEAATNRTILHIKVCRKRTYQPDSVSDEPEGEIVRELTKRCVKVVAEELKSGDEDDTGMQTKTVASPSGLRANRE